MTLSGFLVDLPHKISYNDYWSGPDRLKLTRYVVIAYGPDYITKMNHNAVYVSLMDLWRSWNLETLFCTIC